LNKFSRNTPSVQSNTPSQIQIRHDLLLSFEAKIPLIVEVFFFSGFQILSDLVRLVTIIQHPEVFFTHAHTQFRSSHSEVGVGANDMK